MNCPYCKTEVNDYEIPFCPACGLDFITRNKFILNITPSGMLPKGLSVKNKKNKLTITLKNPLISFSAWFFICIVCIAYYFGHLDNSFFLNDKEPLAGMITFLPALSAITALSLYLLLQTYDTLKIDQRQPVSQMFLKKAKTIESCSIRQIYYERYQKIVRRFGRESGKDEFDYYYSLLALLKTGDSILIMNKIRSPLTAQFIAEKAEEKLGIINFPLPNEYESIVTCQIDNMKITQSNESKTALVTVWKELNGNLIINKKWHAPKNLIPMIALNIAIVISLAIITFCSSPAIPKILSFVIALTIMLVINIYVITLFRQNTTKINIDNTGIDVTVYPIFYPGNVSIDNHKIQNLYVTDTLLQKNTPNYNIIAKLFNGNKYRLISDMQRLDEAQLLVYNIKAILGMNTAR